MRSSIFRVFASILFVLQCTKAQINLAQIPTTAWAGQGIFGSATYSTVTTLATGSQVIPEGAYWDQEGSRWVFDTDTSDIYFGYLALGNGPDAPVDQESCLVLDDSQTKWTLVAPTTGEVCMYLSLMRCTTRMASSADNYAVQVDIDFTAGPSTITGASTTNGSLATTGSTNCCSRSGRPGEILQPLWGCETQTQATSSTGWIFRLDHIRRASLLICFWSR